VKVKTRKSAYKQLSRASFVDIKLYEIFIDIENISNGYMGFSHIISMLRRL
jgi:hypothetical protein